MEEIYNNFAVVLFDQREDTHTVMEMGLTAIEAIRETYRLRSEEKLPAFYISYGEYRNMFGCDPKIEEQEAIGI